MKKKELIEHEREVSAMQDEKLSEFQQMGDITNIESRSDIRLYHGDCLEVMDKLIADGVIIDAIITDPPYGTTAYKWDSVIPFDEMWIRLNKLIKPNGAIVLFGSEPFSSALRMSNIKNYKYDWYWKKTKANGFQHSKNRPMRAIETISVFSNSPMGHRSQLKDRRMEYNPQGIIPSGKRKVTESTHSGNTMGGIDKKSSRPNQVGIEYESYTNFPRDVLEYSNMEKRGLHPTQKPVALMEYLIKTYTNEDEVVLDFTAGSFSTGVACVNTNRKGIMIEQDDKYFDVGVSRVEKAYDDKGIDDGK